MNAVLADYARRADFLLQPYFDLTRALHDERGAGIAGSGAYTSEEWGRHRQALTGPQRPGEDRYASEESYRRYLAAIHDAKIRSVLALLDAFDFTRYPRILELGCGDMPQAFTIVSRHPALDYTATDFDARVIERCAALPLLAPLRKAVLDAVALDPAALAGHDLVTSWSLEFSLDDAQLEALFAACARQRTPYLLCTHTALGPIAWLQRFARASPGGSGGRQLGWLRSVGALARLARRGGMELRWKTLAVNHVALLFTPA